MALKVVVVDGAQLPAGVEFPALQVDKYAWEQYRALAVEELHERCWKADVLISLSTPISRELLKKLDRLKLVITAGSACGALDQAAAREQGVELLAFPDARPEDGAQAQDLCQRITMAIDYYIRNFER